MNRNENDEAKKSKILNLEQTENDSFQTKLFKSSTENFAGSQNIV